jgi:hypothetical protein
MRPRFWGVGVWAIQDIFEHQRCPRTRSVNGFNESLEFEENSQDVLGRLGVLEIPQIHNNSTYPKRFISIQLTRFSNFNKFKELVGICLNSNTCKELVEGFQSLLHTSPRNTHTHTQVESISTQC